MQRTGTHPSDLLTPQEFAHTLALSLRTVTTKRWRIAHGVVGVHVGRSLRFRRSDVERLITRGLERLPDAARR